MKYFTILVIGITLFAGCKKENDDNNKAIWRVTEIEYSRFYPTEIYSYDSNLDIEQITWLVNNGDTMRKMVIKCEDGRAVENKIYVDNIDELFHLYTWYMDYDQDGYLIKRKEYDHSGTPSGESTVTYIWNKDRDSVLVKVDTIEYYQVYDNPNMNPSEFTYFEYRNPWPFEQWFTPYSLRFFNAERIMSNNLIESYYSGPVVTVDSVIDGRVYQITCNGFPFGGPVYFEWEKYIVFDDDKY